MVPSDHLQKKIWMGLFRMVASSKWLTALFAALATSQLDISPEWKAFLIVTLASVYAIATAIEDARK